MTPEIGHLVVQVPDCPEGIQKKGTDWSLSETIDSKPFFLGCLVALQRNFHCTQMFVYMELSTIFASDEKLGTRLIYMYMQFSTTHAHVMS